MFIAILVWGSVFYRLYVLLISCLSLLYPKQKVIESNSDLSQHYCFLFPVYKEQKIIKDTLQYYEQFLAQSQQIQLIFITTAKETGSDTTLKLMQDYLKNSQYQERIVVVTCPVLDGTKATQINYGLDFIAEKKQKSYVCMFDCDARISFLDLVRAEQYIKDNSGAVIYSFLPKAKPAKQSNFLVLSAGLHHTERMLAFEYAASQLPWKYSYPMGATMLVHPQLWQHIDHIPEPIDDIPLDYLLQFKKLKAKTMPFYTLVQPPPDTRNLFRQMIPIFKGVFSYFSTAHRYGIKLNIVGYGHGLLVYTFYLLEPLSIFLVLLGDWWLGILIFVQIIVNLYWVKKLSTKAFIAHSWGYIIRLLQFLYFGINMLKGEIRLSQFKTERK